MAVTLKPTIPTFQPQTGAAHRVKVEGNYRPTFTLMWHPDRGYELLDGKFVPILNTFPHRPGANNVRKDGDAGYALSKQQRMGWTLVPAAAASPDYTPDNGDGYVRIWPGERGPHHEHAWVQYEGSHGRWVRRIEEKGWAAFRFSLVTRGLIPAADDGALDVMREKLHKQRDRYAGRADVNPYAASSLQKTTEEIEIFEKAVAKLKRSAKK